MSTIEPRHRRIRRLSSLEALEGRALLATVSIVNPAGPISAITIGSDGSFQVRRDDFQGGQAFPNNRDPADAGLFLRHPDGTVVGFDSFGRSATNYRTGADPTLSHALFPLSLSLSSDGLKAILVADNRNDGNTAGQYFQLTQILTYVPGDDYFRVDNTIVNLGTSPITLDAFAAADLYLADTDRGVSYYDATTGAIGGSDLLDNYTIFVQPNLAGGLTPTGFQAGYFQDIWRAIGQGSHLSSSVTLPVGQAPWTSNDPSYTDNGAALEWQGVTIGPASSARLSYFWSFGGSQAVAPDPPPSVSALPIVAHAGQVFDGPIATFTSSDPLAQPGDFIATVQWGDGTFLELATVQVVGGSAGFTVSATHTYANGGDYPVTIAVVAPGGGAATAVTTATVSGGQNPPPGNPATIAGDLAPESDRGAFNNDRVTNDNQPTLRGSATAASTWQITAMLVDGSGPAIALGNLTATSTGSWSLGSTAVLPDGKYTVTARLDGAPSTLPPTVLIAVDRPLIIDTQGPRITGLVVVPKRGRLSLVVRDEVAGVDGLNIGQLAIYRLTNKVNGRLKTIKLRMDGVSASASGSPTASVALTTLNKKLPAGKRYRFRVETAIRDLAGNTLAGRFIGQFPTGLPNGTTSPFDVNIQTNGKKLLALKPVAGA